ncbi:NAD(P)-dependent alcohol dehydrogenase [Oricola sp.]|uniref:quinone oxidoreductase family protein n=1 Tax=Oricola sp. TaxID=1979950 RepID=UPI0025EC13C6|nr:NAD(P)-dependent alcohol dehydrogenase [Oricola sp.]MCI5076370.1 NAD(P)-dependent alcohol dehydrogenase [Oricola sp.]
MKAIVQYRYGGPEALRLADLPVPEPGPGELRVKVSACAVNLSDWEYLTGSPFYARMAGGLRRPTRPVLGSDIVGTVDRLGPDVTGFLPGQRIMGDFVMTRGGFADYACVPASHAVAVPDALTDEVAACLPQAGGIAVWGTRDLVAGETFLINGAGGGSGTMALQLAKAAGAQVTTVDNAGKTDWLASLGADAVIDYRETDFTRMGERWDRILDMVATRGPLAIARALEQGGTYRAAGGDVGVLLSLLGSNPLFRLRGKSIGMLLVPSGRDLTQQVAQAAVDGRIAPHLADVLPLSAVPDALARTGRGEVLGKLVIRP